MSNLTIIEVLFSAGLLAALVYFVFLVYMASTERQHRSVMRYTATEPELSGKAYVIDGDTIHIRGVKIRIWGIDAPELDDPYGRKSKSAMIDICKDHNLTAEPRGTDRYGRTVAKVVRDDGVDVGAEMVRQGHALDWPLFSDGFYRKLEPEGARDRILGSRRVSRAATIQNRKS